MEKNFKCDHCGTSYKLTIEINYLKINHPEENKNNILCDNCNSLFSKIPVIDNLKLVNKLFNNGFEYKD